jgi:hypothetical protein
MNGIKNPLRKTRKDKGQMRGSYRARWDIERKLEGTAAVVPWYFMPRCECCGQRMRTRTGTLEYLFAQLAEDRPQPKREKRIQAQAKAMAIARRKPLFDRREYH